MNPFAPPRRTPRAPGLLGLLRHLCLLLAGLALVACNDTGWPARDPIVMTDPDADTLRVWPPRAYALPGERLDVEVRGLKTVSACAQVTELAVTTADSGSVTWRSLTARVERPGVPDCPVVNGKDTLVETLAPAAGRTLVLRTPRGRATDSLFVIAGSGDTREFLHAGSRTDTLNTHGRFTFRDSTAGHPRRRLYTDSLATCEVLQAASFLRLNGGDTLRIRYRTLLAAPALPPDIFPACAGVHADSVTIVENRHGLAW